MSHIKQVDHVGVTVADLDSVTAFFVDLGLEVEGRASVEGDVIDTVTGIPDSRTEMVMLRTICFEVDDLQAVVDTLAERGHGLVGGIGQHEQSWRMAYVRGPEGLVVAVAERIG